MRKKFNELETEGQIKRLLEQGAKSFSLYLKQSLKDVKTTESELWAIKGLLDVYVPLLRDQESVKSEYTGNLEHRKRIRKIQQECEAIIEGKIKPFRCSLPKRCEDIRQIERALNTLRILRAEKRSTLKHEQQILSTHIWEYGEWSDNLISQEKGFKSYGRNLEI